MNSSQLGVSTSVGGKLILNTENSGALTTTSQDGHSTAHRKKIKPYQSNQTRRMPDNPGSGPGKKTDGNAYSSLMQAKPRDASANSA